jgi:hypothetical protein
MKKTNHALNIYFTLAYTGSLMTLLVDSYKNSETIAKYLFVNSTIIFVAFLFVNAWIRMKSNYQVPCFLLHFNSRVILPVSSVLAIGLSIWDSATPTNYIYGRFEINYEKLFYLALWSITFMFIWKSNLWWKRNWKKFIFLSAPFCFLVFLIIRIWPFDFFLNMVLEDHFVENTQFFVILFASPLAVITARLLWSKNRLLSTIYILLGLTSIFIAGDEISWGQRILHFQTPSNISVHNNQNEFTVHNLDEFAKYTWGGYLTLSIYGSFSWLLFKTLPKKWKYYLSYLSPPWFVSSFFILSFIYNLFSNPTTPTYIREWSEPSELIMYGGIFLFFLSSYIVVKGNNYN